VARLQAAVMAEATRAAAAKAEAAAAARIVEGERSAGLKTATHEVAALKAQLAEVRATAGQQVLRRPICDVQTPISKCTACTALRVLENTSSALARTRG